MSTPSYDAQTSPGQPTAPPSPYTDHGAPAMPYAGSPTPYAGSTPPPGQPPTPGYYGPQQPRPATEKRGLAITALVLGIVAILGCWIPILNIGSILIGLVGVVLGIVAIVKAARGAAGGKVMAIVGIALSAVAIVLSIIVSAMTVSVIDTTINEQPELFEQSLEDAGLEPEDAEALTSGEVATTADAATFDETYTFEDGLAITVTAPQLFEPSEYAAGVEGGGTPVAMEITIENGTGEVFEPYLMFLIVASGGSESEAIYDDGIDTLPSSSIQPGKSLTFTRAYMVADVTDVQLELEPSYLDYETLTFIN